MDSLNMHNIWMMVATFLVFIMHLGFATVESGFTQSKNTTNILFKNTIIPAIGLLTFAGWGFNLMYPGTPESIGGIFNFGGWGLSAPMVEDPETGKMVLDLAYNEGYTYWTDFLFQGMFAATAATIVSGAVAERIKLFPFLIFSLIFVGVIYPIIGSWHWGVGFLNVFGNSAEEVSMMQKFAQMTLDGMSPEAIAAAGVTNPDHVGFYDFAGSTLVHSVGGWGALAGAIVLGPRIGKYVAGKLNPIPGHSLPLATVGVFLLWLGWFGFNGGSVLSADAGSTSLVLVTTCLAAAAGAISAAAIAYFITKKGDLGMALNGILAGLVGITAGADQMGMWDSVIIGAISGILCVLSVLFFDKLKIDDPVGAISVHLVCGIFGTLAVGIFGASAGGDQFMYQLAGVGCTALLAFPAAFLIFYLLKITIGLRVSKEEEVEGLDIGEHGMNAYRI